MIARNFYRLLPIVLIALTVMGCAGPIRFNPEATPPGSVWRTAAGKNLVHKWSNVIQVPERVIYIVNNLGDRPIWVVTPQRTEHFIKPGERFEATFKSFGDSARYAFMVKMQDACWRWASDTRIFDARAYGFSDPDYWEINHLLRSGGCNK